MIDAYHSPQAQQLIDAAHAVGARGLTWGSSGNISVRISPTAFLISASGCTLGALTPPHLVLCSLDGTSLVAGRRPSLEVQMHAAAYVARPDIGSVLHGSPFFTTAVASSPLNPDPALTTDTLYYLRTVERVPFALPGSTALADLVGRAARDCDAILLTNHGAVTVGAEPAEAVTRMETLEMLCRLTVLSAIGLPVEPLAPGAAAHMLAHLAGDTPA
jgi:L-fuculose-phosphate aldolase